MNGGYSESKYTSAHINLQPLARVRRVSNFSAFSHVACSRRSYRANAHRIESERDENEFESCFSFDYTWYKEGMHAV